MLPCILASVTAVLVMAPQETACQRDVFPFTFFNFTLMEARTNADIAMGPDLYAVVKLKRRKWTGNQVDEQVIMYTGTRHDTRTPQWFQSWVYRRDATDDRRILGTDHLLVVVIMDQAIIGADRWLGTCFIHLEEVISKFSGFIHTCNVDNGSWTTVIEYMTVYDVDRSKLVMRYDHPDRRLGPHPNYLQQSDADLTG